MVDYISPPHILGTESEFALVTPRSSNQLRSGASKGLKYGASFWRASVSTPAMHNEDKDAWRAFFDEINDEGAIALLADPERPYPRAYEDFSGMEDVNESSFADGLAKVFSVTDARNLTIYEVPSLFELKQGDYVELRHGTRSYLHRIAEDATANAGGSVTVKVRPPLSPSIAADDVACFKEAKGEFIIEDVSGLGNGVLPTPIKFSAKSRSE